MKIEEFVCPYREAGVKSRVERLRSSSGPVGFRRHYAGWDGRKPFRAWLAKAYKGAGWATLADLGLLVLAGLFLGGAISGATMQERLLSREFAVFLAVVLGLSVKFLVSFCVCRNVEHALEEAEKG